MAVQNSESLYQKQKKIRPRLEEVLVKYLSGNERESALDFAAWLRTNKMPPQWGSANSWSVSYRKIRVCYIKLENKSWYICPSQYGNGSDYYNDFMLDESMKELVWANLRPCQSCTTCAPGKNMIVFGKEFHNICVWYTIRFRNLTGDALEDVKRVIVNRNNTRMLQY